MAIRDNIQAIINIILQERAASEDGETSATGDEMAGLAKAAILAGQGDPANNQITPDWEAFMTFFAGRPTNAQQLARLLPRDGTHTDAVMQRERAYLAGNAMCGATTPDTTLDGDVTANLDV